MNVRYQSRVDLFAGMGRFSIRNLGQNDALGNKQRTSALPCLDVDDLVFDYLSRYLIHCRGLSPNEDSGLIFIVVYREKDSVASLPLVENHANETASPV